MTPQFFLLDEPTSNQGIKHQMKVTEIIREMVMNREISVIMAARNINLAFKYTDRSLRLCNRSNPENLSQSAIMGA